MASPSVSIVIPVHNEQEVLEQLYQRLMPVMDALPNDYEIIFTNDGSTDNSAVLLNQLHERRPKQIRIIHFNGNYGQHMAIMAGFEICRGEFVVTMDADLQNPPEEIPKLLQALSQGHDVINCYRVNRQDQPWRLLVSRLHNWVRAKITPKIKMKDEGCMLRGYRRHIVNAMTASGEASTFIPALALTFASNPIEIPVAHESRAAGTSSYGFYALIRYNFDLITGFSLVPLQIFTLIGIVISLISAGFVTFLFVRRLIVGPEAEGVFTLFAILFSLIGILLMGLGIIGEYIGRIYQEVRRRPRFIVREVVENNSTERTPVKESV